MTDLTTRPAEVGTPGPATPTPANGAAVADIRTLRHVVRAEQERLSADAELERRARAARLDLELREQRRTAARRARDADAAAKQARTAQRRSRRVGRRAELLAAAPRWADRTLFILPIMFPMAVAWVGQIRFAMTVMGWPLPAAIVFAAGFELSTAYVARLDWLSRAAGDSALLFRGATWGFAAGAATMNYWHAAGPGFAPNGAAVSYGLMSVTGVVLWELLSTYRHRISLRAEGKLPAARPRLGLTRWIWFGSLTRLAWLLTVRDGHATTDLAWRVAIGAVERYGSVKNARKAVRAGRPVPYPGHCDEENDSHETTDPRDIGSLDVRDVESRGLPRDSLDISSRSADADRDNPRGFPTPSTAAGSDELEQRGNRPNHGVGDEPDGMPDAARTAPSDEPPGTPADNRDRDGQPTPEQGGASGRRRAPDGAEVPDANPDDRRRRRGEPGGQALAATMLAYAQARLAEGASITGADLDREFRTRDYGRKILRRLANDNQGIGTER